MNIKWKMNNTSSQFKQQYEENFALLREKYPEVAHWLQTSNGRGAIAVKLQSGDFAFLLEKDGKKYWLTDPVEPKLKAKNFLKQNFNLVKRGEPLLLVGIGAGYELMELFSVQPRIYLWMKQPIYVVEKSADILRLNLEIHNWKNILDSGRIFFFVGKKIDQKLKEFFHDALKPLPHKIFIYEIPQQKKQPFTRKVVKVMRDITEKRKEEGKHLSREINRYYGSLSREDWQKIFSHQRKRPLRILLLTTRFSTFIQYCIRDAAQGFKTLGHQTKTVIEKADTDRLTFLEILRNLSSFKPDMIFRIDHLRTEHEPIYPKNIPFVCWIQDELPNLFNQQTAKSIGKRDILLVQGNTLMEELLHIGYPSENIYPLPVPTNINIYHPRNLTREEREKYACDISYISHLSLPPERAFDSLLTQFSNLNVKEVLKIMFELTRERFHSGDDCYTKKDYEFILLEAEREKNTKITDTKTRAYILSHFYHKIGNAFFRQLPLEWIAREGYDIRIYGTGWDKHPRLSKYARGVVSNGEEVCKVYNASKVNLQIHHLHNLHQRLIDGIASGGFFLIKYHPVDYKKGELSDYFDINKDVVRFKGKIDLLKKVKFYLTHPEKRKLIVKRAQKKVLERLTYTSCMKFVIDTVKKQIEKS